MTDIELQKELLIHRFGTETYLIFSIASFTSALAALQNGIQAPTAEQEYIGALSNPVEVAYCITIAQRQWK